MTDAEINGEANLTLRDICTRCKVSSTSVARHAVGVLEAMGVVTFARFKDGRIVPRSFAVVQSYYTWSVQ